MIDLNVRLDSSLSEDEYKYLAHLQGIELPSDFPKGYKVDLDNAKKEDYFKARELALELLQTEEAIQWAFESLIHRLYRYGYVYLEIAFTPFLHLKEGLSQRRLIKIALDGIHNALERCKGFKVGLILYAHREASFAFNQETMHLALENRDQGIVAIGIEGDDKGKKVSSYEKFFRPAKMSEFPIVFELGENFADEQSIKDAVELGAKRIIFPYALPVDFMLASQYCEKHIYFEYHPSCDFVLGRGKSLKEFAIKDTWAYGYQGYIASYGSFICDSDLIHEARKLKKAQEFKREDFQHSVSVSVQAAFIKDILDKTRLIQLFAKYFDSFYSRTV